MRSPALRNGISGSEPTQPRATPQQILVIRQDSIGDAVLTSAMLRELRRNSPDAAVTLVTRLVVRSIFEHCPYIDRLVHYDFSGSRNPHEAAQAAALFSEQVLRPIGFDIALLPRYDFDFWGGRAMIAACGAPVRIGYAVGLTPLSRRNREAVSDPFSLTLAPDDLRHEAERDLALVEAMGGKIVDRHLELWPLASDRRDLASRLTAFRSNVPGPLVALAPGAANRVRIWPLERFVAVGSSLVERVAARIVVVGGNSELAAGAAVATSLGEHALDLTGRLDLNRTFAAVAACDLLISNDSAPVHLASAAGTPVAMLSPHGRNGNANAHMSPQRFGPWMTHHRVLQPVTLQTPCSETCTAVDAHCILEIPVNAVVAASLELLALTGRY
jgi:ADP-heptose:LPS heptosyltransferase